MVDSSGATYRSHYTPFLMPLVTRLKWRVVAIICVFLCCSQSYAQTEIELQNVMSKNGYLAYSSALSLYRQGALEESQAVALALLENAQPETLDAAAAKRIIALIAMRRGQYDFAQRTLTQVLNEFRAREKIQLVALVQADLGNNLSQQSLHSNALNLYNSALSTHEVFGNTEQTVTLYNSIAATLEKMGQYERALEALTKALELQREKGQRQELTVTLFNIAEIHRELAQLEQAEAYFNDALTLAIELNNQTQVARIQSKLGFIHIESGNFAAAEASFNRAINWLAKMEHSLTLAESRAGLGQALIGQNKIADGMALLNEALTHAEAHGFLALKTKVRLILAQVHLQLSNYPTALEQAEIGLEEATQRKELPRQAEFESVRVEIYEKTGEFALAYAALKRQKQIEALILQQRRDNALTALQAEVEYVRQEQDIALLRKNKASELNLAEQRNARNVLILASLIVFLLLAFLFFSRHAQKLRNEQLTGIVKRRTQELEKKNEELQQAYRTLEHMSLRDSLTGCYNRHFLDANLPAEVNRSLFSHRSAKESNQPPSLHNDLLCFLLDIDDFKAINDTYGHVTGDRVLIQFGKIIANVFRHSDLQVRWGGEEFLVICRNTPRLDAAMLAERLRATIADTPFRGSNEKKFHVSCSIGFTAFPLDIEQPERLSWEQCFGLADHCLYSAKRSGKNCWIGITQATENSQEPLSPQEKALALGALEVQTSLNHLSSIKWQEIIADTPTD
ncbi:tetratricopeptide repeat-containing diguanylate cyclase [Alteromonas flava]|uniref:tetratricopeptide repeat-containing diguanylate cyclase n=1 Tax=Alteromonas flava TaxID=2048003 RepID=UPI000F5FF747|nr:tetratricopeptide repeat-containing diguanylate cyclase [Alteromonas flava]